MKTKAVTTLSLLMAFFMFLTLADARPKKHRPPPPISGGSPNEYYLDPDFTGTPTGSQTQPFNTLDAAAWTTINGSLASGDVIVYCSARNAGSDTDQAWGQQIFIDGNKTANPAFTLTLDGRSRYNTNDASPNWLVYTGSSRCQVQSITSQNASHIQYNKVTINGFGINQSGNSKAVSVCGNDWIIQGSDIRQSGTPVNQPTILITPTSDAAHEGSSAWCPASTNITIQDNVIHDTHAEAIYVGGAGCSVSDADLSDTNCNGKPGHSNITIQRNTLFNCGVDGGGVGEGDCIDIKAAITNLTVSQNTISANMPATRCIVAQGIQTDGTDQNIVIERNRIYGCNVSDGAIALSNTWGTPNGYTIRNNLIYNITSSSAGDCISVYATQAAGLKVYSNTLYNCLQFAVGGSGTMDVKNNAVLNNNGGGAQTNMSGTITADHNAFGGTWGGTCTSCVSGLTTASFRDVAAGDFTLPSNSVLRNQAVTIGSFATDYAGTIRIIPWDIGAYEGDAPGVARYGGRSTSIFRTRWR